MYSRKRPDSHRFMGGRSHVFCCRWALVSSVLKINIQRSRTPFVFEKCLILSRSVFDTDTDELRHTLCVCLSNVCMSPTAHSDIVAHLRHNARKHDYCQSTCRLLSIFFSSIFYMDATLKCILLAVVSCRLRSPPRLLCVPQLTSDSVSNTHQMPSDVYHNWLLIRSQTPIRCKA